MPGSDIVDVGARPVESEQGERAKMADARGRETEAPNRREDRVSEDTERNTGDTD
jgi:hypothetical protein